MCGNHGIQVCQISFGIHYSLATHGVWHLGKWSQHCWNDRSLPQTCLHKALLLHKKASEKSFRHLSVTKTEEEGKDKPFPSWLAFVLTSKTHGFSVQNLEPLQSQKTNGLASSHYKVLQPGQLKLIFFSLNQIWMGKSMKRNGSQLHKSTIFQLSVLNKSRRDVFPDKAISMVCLKPTSGVPAQFIFPSRPRLPMTNCYYSGNC